MNLDLFTILMVFAFGLSLSFLFSGMEAGVFALSRLRIRKLKRQGNERAEILHRYLENPENFLWTILVGNTLANFASVSLVFLLLYERWNDHLALCAGVFLAVLFGFYAFFELLPKMLFRRFPNRLCLILAKPFRFIHLILSPLVALVEWFSRGLLRWTGGKKFTGHLFGNREELRFLMQESAQILTSEERTMINRVLDLQNLVAREITTPLAETITVTANAPVAEVIALFRDKNITRVPVWEAAGPQRIAGVLSLDTLLYRSDLDPAKTAGHYVKPALFVNDDMRVEEVLRKMQRSGRRLGIVVSRDQREIGIVTFHDILRVIFGEVKL